jgi:hypothetical protein
MIQFCEGDPRPVFTCPQNFSKLSPRSLNGVRNSVQISAHGRSALHHRLDECTVPLTSGEKTAASHPDSTLCAAG